MQVKRMPSHGGSCLSPTLTDVARFELGAPLNQPNPSTYYAEGATGYTDYPPLEMAD